MIVFFLAIGGLVGCPLELPVQCSSGDVVSCYPTGATCACTQRSQTDMCFGQASGKRFVGTCNYDTAECEQSCYRSGGGCAASEDVCTTKCDASELAITKDGSEVCFPAAWDGVPLAPECLGLLALRATDPRNNIAGQVTCPETQDQADSYLDCPCPPEVPLKCASPEGYVCINGASFDDCPATICSHPTSHLTGVCSLETGECIVSNSAPAQLVLCADGTLSSSCSVPCSAPYSQCVVGGVTTCVYGDCSCRSTLSREEQSVCRRFKCGVTDVYVSSPAACPCPVDSPVRCVQRSGVTCLPKGQTCPQEACNEIGTGVCDFAVGACVCPFGYDGENCTTVLQLSDSAGAYDVDPDIGTDRALGGEEPELYICAGSNVVVTRVVDCPCPDEAPTRCQREGVVDCFSEDVRCECAALLTLDTKHLSCPNDNVTCPDGKSVNHPLDCDCKSPYEKKCLTPYGFTCEPLDVTCPLQLPCLNGRGVCDLATGVCQCHDGLAGLDCQPRGSCSRYTCVQNSTSAVSLGVQNDLHMCGTTCPSGTSVCKHEDNTVVTCLPDGYDCGCAGARYFLPIRLILDSNDTDTLAFGCKEYTGVDELASHPLECLCPSSRPKMCITDDGPHCVTKHDRCPGSNSLLNNCTKGCDMYQGKCSTCDALATCGGKGLCSQESSRWPCQCFQDDARGHWADQWNCSKCDDGWFGPDCTKTCANTFCGVNGECVEGECYCKKVWFDRGFEGTTCSKCVSGYRGGGNCTIPENYVAIYMHSYEYVLNGFQYGFDVEVFNEAALRSNPDDGAMLHVALPLSEYLVDWVLPPSCYHTGNASLQLNNNTVNNTRSAYCSLGNLEDSWSGHFRTTIPIAFTGGFVAWARLIMKQGLALAYPLVGGDQYSANNMLLPDYDMYPLMPETDQPRTALMTTMPEVPEVLFSFNDSLQAALVDKNFTIAPYLYNNGPGYATIFVRLNFPDAQLAVDTFWLLPSTCMLNSSHVVMCEVVLAPGEQWRENAIGILLDRLAPNRPIDWVVPGGLRIEATIWNHHQNPDTDEKTYNVTHIVEEPYVAITNLDPVDVPRIGYTHTLLLNMSYPRQSERSPHLTVMTFIVEVDPYEGGEETVVMPTALTGGTMGDDVLWSCEPFTQKLMEKREAAWNMTEVFKWRAARIHRWACTWHPLTHQLFPGATFYADLVFHLLATHQPGELVTRVTTIDPMVTNPFFTNETHATLTELVESPKALLYISPDIIRPGFTSDVHINYTQLVSWANEVYINVTIFNADLAGGAMDDLSLDGCSFVTFANRLTCYIGSSMQPGQAWSRWFKIFYPATSTTVVHLLGEVSLDNVAPSAAPLYDAVSLDPVLPDVSVYAVNTTVLHPGMRAALQMNLTVPETAIATNVQVNCTFSGHVRIYRLADSTDTAVSYSGMPARKYPYPVTVTPTEQVSNVTMTSYQINATDYVTVDVSGAWDSSHVFATTLRWDDVLTFNYEVLLAEQATLFNATCVVTTDQNPSGYVHDFTLPFTPAPHLTLQLSHPAGEAWVMDPVVVQWNLSQHEEQDAYFEDVVVDFTITATEEGFVDQLLSLTCPWADCSCTLTPLRCVFLPLIGDWERSGALTFLIAPGSHGNFYVRANATSHPQPWIHSELEIAHYVMIPLHLPNAALRLWPITPLVPGYEMKFQMNVTITGKGYYHGALVRYDLRNSYGLTLTGHPLEDFSISKNCTVTPYPAANRSKAHCNFPTLPLPFTFSQVVSTMAPMHLEIPILLDARIAAGDNEQSYVDKDDDEVGVEMWPHLPVMQVNLYNNTPHVRDTTSYLTLEVHNKGHLISVAHNIVGTLSIAPGKNAHSHVMFHPSFNNMAQPSVLSTRHLLSTGTTAPCASVTGHSALNCSYGSIGGKSKANLTFPVAIGITADTFCMNVSIDGPNWASRKASDLPAAHAISYCSTLEDVPYEQFNPTVKFGLRPGAFVNSEMQFGYSRNDTEYGPWFKTKRVAAGAVYDFALFLTNLPVMTTTSWGRYGYDRIYVNITISPKDIERGGTLLDMNRVVAIPSECFFSDAIDNVECALWNTESNVTLPFQLKTYTGLRGPLQFTVEVWATGVDHLNTTLIPHSYGVLNASGNVFVYSYPSIPPATQIGFDYDDTKLLPGRRGTMYLNISNPGTSCAQLFVVSELLGDMRFPFDFNMTTAQSRPAAINVSLENWYVDNPPLTYPASRTLTETYTGTFTTTLVLTASETETLTATSTITETTLTATSTFTIPTATETEYTLTNTFTKTPTELTDTESLTYTGTDTFTLSSHTLSLTFTLPTLTYVSNTQTYTVPTATFTYTETETVTDTLTLTESVTQTPTPTETFTSTITIHITGTESESLFDHRPPAPWDGFRRYNEWVDPEQFGMERTSWTNWPGTFLDQINTTVLSPFGFTVPPRSELVSDNRRMAVAQFLLHPDAHVVLPMIFDVVGPYLLPGMKVTTYFENMDTHYEMTHNFQTAQRSADLMVSYNKSWDYPSPGENNITILLTNQGAGWAGKTTIVMELMTEGVHFAPLITDWISPYHTCQYNESRIVCEVLGVKSQYDDDTDGIQPLPADPTSVDNHHKMILPWKYELPITILVDQYFNGTLNFTVDVFTENDYDITNNKLILNPTIIIPDLRPLLVWPQWPETAYELRIYNSGPTSSSNVRTVLSVTGGIVKGIYDPQVVNPHYDVKGVPALISLPLGERKGTEYLDQDQDCFTSSTGDFLKCVITDIPYDPALPPERNYVSRWFRVDVAARAQLTFEGAITNEDRNLANNGIVAQCPVHSECWTDVNIVQVTGCLDIWPSTVNCPPDGSATITVWGQGFGYNNDARIQVYVGGGRCESLKWYNASEYTSDPAWTDHQVLLCDSYLGWSEGDDVPESRIGYGDRGSFGEKLSEKEGLSFPVTVVNWRERNKTEDRVTVSFAYYPIITGIDNCGETNQTWKGCPTNGLTTLEILGQHFIGYGGFGAVEVMLGHYPCITVQVVNDSLIHCTRYPGYGTMNRLRVKANGLWDRSAYPTYMSYRPVPRIEQISGCFDEGMYTHHCNQNGQQILTIVGYDLWFDSGGVREIGDVQIGGFSCVDVHESNDIMLNHFSTVVNSAVYKKEGTTLRCSGYPWRGSMGHLGTNVSVQVYLHGETNVEAVSMSFSELMIEKVSGCLDFHPSTVNCHSTGLNSITMIGKGFGNTGARVWIGDSECETVVHGLVLNETILHGYEAVVCSDYIPPTLFPSYHPSQDYPFQPPAATVFPTIQTVYGLNYTERRVSITFSRRPEVHATHGCTDSSNHNHTKECFTNGTMPLHVLGRHFLGDLGFGMPTVWVGPNECKKQEIISDRHIVCFEYPGQGDTHRVEVRRGIMYTDKALQERSGRNGFDLFFIKQLQSALEPNVEAARWMADHAWREDIYATYRPRPFANAISGCGCTDELRSLGVGECDLETANHTVLCSTGGETPLTIKGYNFGTSGAEVYIGGREARSNMKCSQVLHDGTTPDTVVYCSGYKFAGQNLKVTVVQNDEESRNPLLLSFVASCPFWSWSLRKETVGQSNNGTMCNSRGVCDSSCPGSPAQCICTSDATSGYWDGIACQDCRYGYFGIECKFQCPGGAINPCNSQGLCIGGIYGPGICDCYDGYAGTSCEKACPRDTRDRICGGHLTACSNGTYGSGTCNCPSDATDGFWTGLSCDSCQSGWSQQCKTPCAGGYLTPCNGRGVCQEGPEGNGTCSCNFGYAGTQCEIACNGGPTNPCSLNGICDPTDGSCHCYENYENGFWEGTSCEGCLYGFSGTTTQPVGCITACPKNETGAVCSDIGTCTGGTCFCPELHPTSQVKVCGISCNVTGTVCDQYACPSTFWGSTCTGVCKGKTVNAYGVAVSCSGHGRCSDGMLGTGECFCDSGYGADSCIECPGGATTPCNFHGTCSSVDGKCTCYNGYAAADCGTPCAGGAITPCSAHGVCSQGSTGDGTCVCEYGYLGVDCSSECPGGASNICSGNGNCTTTGACVCEDSDDGGHWTGTDCSTCIATWFGSKCHKTCPRSKISGFVCNSHGVCPDEIDKCNCDNSADKGYWRGDVCEDCQTGYWGANCRFVCPGGACSPCNGHGSCSDGVVGQGWCNCTSDSSGWWSLNDCSDCKEGWYGTACTQECPGGWIRPCSGNGVCNSGVFGSGACKCNSDATTTGIWGGALCDDCAGGWFGHNCSLSCPTRDLKVCGGKGVCNDGLGGNGLCDCFPGYAGFTCEKECPRDTLNRVCGGFTTACDDGRVGTALCTCPRDTTSGFWAEPDCATCRSGYGGSDCTIECPGGSVNPCSGNGVCADGSSGSGACVCSDGFSGAACQLECPGGQGNHCSRRGTCVSGACQCLQNPVQGYWAGSVCDACLSTYSGQSCTIACPLGSGLPCTGRGRCYEGQCLQCTDSSCGTACELTGTDCDALLCPAAKYGPTCGGTCLGTVSDVPCSGHGSCDDGRLGSGKCACLSGYAGSSCELECDGGASTPCSGNGYCNSTHTGKCTCNIFFATATCASSCQGYGTTAGVCSGRGECSMGASGDGSCTCTFGWAGEACEKECPGGYANPCSGHGSCDQLTAKCVCTDDANLGRFGGTDCSNCLNGYYGSGCLSFCPPATGTTQGQECACNQGWATSDCSVECFGGASNACSRNGKCNETNSGDGTCTCNYGFRGQACASRCAGHAATASECSGNGICQQDASCQCFSNEKQGFWAPPDCGTCSGDYFGLHCDQLCPRGPNNLPCSNNGFCSPTQGICQCREDADAGYWEGVACEGCQPGYWGTRCKITCPGGACNPCGGHGKCDAGVLGSGRCTCTGAWEGVNCDGCLPGYFGKTCTQTCPGGVTSDTWCSGHGDCSQGPTGSGDCICHKLFSGFWAGPLCDQCAVGYYGPTCTGKCPGDTLPCSGSGDCSQGLTGTGLCTCYRGFASNNCSVACPIGPNGDYCSGATFDVIGGVTIESCDWGASATGVCRCPGSTQASGMLHGFLTGVACERCQSGYAGSECKTICPGQDGAAICSGHGTCEDGKSGTGGCVCSYGYSGTDCSVVCTGGSILPCGGRGKCQQGDPGPPLITAGSCKCFASVSTGYYAEPDCLSCAYGWSGRFCDKKCPDKGGVVCSGHGTCMDGICYCDTAPTPYCSDACELKGYSQCSLYICPAGYYGSSCTTECLGGAANPCSGHGRCNAGTKGDGSCTCLTGYASADCSIVCDGGALFPCSGTRGTCDELTGKCTCKTGFATYDCSVECSGGAGSACSSHGTCHDGSLGDGTCSCESGYTGSDCSIECKGGAANPCSSHGVCLTDGSCKCFSNNINGHWQGVQCDKCESQYSGAHCLNPCIHGTSVLGECKCNPGYANQNCTLECAGYVSAGYQLVCAGHGVCNDGNKGDGLCTCAAGYVGSFCNLQCPGIVSSQPCSGHGQCDTITSKCLCTDTTAGHWAGTACAVCAEGWFGAACDATCPSSLPHPTLCSGHGECDPQRVQCNCFQNSTFGFWDGFDCQDCTTGYWGTKCEKECQGGACKPCSGHGSCFDGWCSEGVCESWRGTCNCTENSVDGFWAGTNCDACSSGYYSSLCTSECPGGVSNICSGRGTCSEGQYGTGECTCNYASDTGYWGQTACEDCWVGFYGKGCGLSCPGNVLGKPITCSDHGTCSDRQQGTGVCTCFKGYAGIDCGIACPRRKLAFMDSEVVCTGHGTCFDGIDGDGTCTCTKDFKLGRWLGVSCSECGRGYWGESCISECLGGANTPCSGHGQCREGTTGDGSCVCDFGWSLSDCSKECDGGAARPCFGRGKCRPADGGCDCVKSKLQGYWDGSKCDSCAYGWSGTQCDIECPNNGTTTDPGLPCSGVGICRDGVCYSCEVGHCNSLTKKACQVSGPQCSVNLCGTGGQWGPNCENECPGGIGVATCSGKGTCSDGRIGNGLCACDPGYMFADCSTECPGGANTPCTNRGVCDTVLGTCNCYNGFAGKACQIECQGGYYNPCNGHGICDDGSSRNGTCLCFDGWAGKDCSVECTGGHVQPCSGNGVCSKVDGSCACFSNPKAGFWESSNCDLCQQGYYEANCTAKCTHGSTQPNADKTPGGVCVCDQHWARLSCDFPCPVSNDTAATPCSGNGYCEDGHTNIGNCVCNNNFYTSNCAVHCSADITCTKLAHAQCNTLTGICECQDNADGHWAGPSCNQCKKFWWGDACSKPCICNFHGTCARGSGVCHCFKNSVDGHWASSDCSTCADGYVGFECTSNDVRITRTKDAATPVRFKMKVTDVGTHLPDPVYGLSYVGGRPVLMWDTKTETMLDSIDLGSAVVSGWIGTDIVHLMTQDDVIHQFFRGKRTYASAKTGTPVSSGGSVSVDSIVTGASRQFQVLSEPSLGRNFSYSTKDALHILSKIPYDRELNIPITPVDPYGRTFATQNTVGLKLVETITDKDQDLVYLIWAGTNARQIYYQRSSTLALVRIIDVSQYIDTVNSVTFFKGLGKLCLAGSKGGRWEVVMFQTATLQAETLSTKVTINTCETCSEALFVRHSGIQAFVSLRVDKGLKMARINVQLYQVLEYDTLRRLPNNNVHVTAMLLDELSNAGFVFAHIGAEPTVVYKFYMDTLRIYGTNKFFSTGTAVERIISVSADKYVSLFPPGIAIVLHFFSHYKAGRGPRCTWGVWVTGNSLRRSNLFTSRGDPSNLYLVFLLDVCFKMNSET